MCQSKGYDRVGGGGGAFLSLSAVYAVRIGSGKAPPRFLPGSTLGALSKLINHTNMNHLADKHRRAPVILG